MQRDDSQSDVTSIQKAIDEIVGRLRTDLDDRYTYHCLEHTLDVMDAAVRIGKEEAVSPENLELLRMSAAFHDCGFLISDVDHEERGCEIARRILPRHNFDDLTIDKVCGMIMATKVPQQPTNHLEQILCDADLDYLGRTDFHPISELLYQEFLSRGIVKDYDSWMNLQVNFFNSHHFWTDYSKKVRTPAKQSHLQSLMKEIG